MKNSDKRKKKVVVSGYYGFDNFGDEAILGVLTEKLKAHGAEVTVLSSNPERTAYLYGVKSQWYFCLIQAAVKIARSDILVSGGGSLLQDVTSLKSLLYYLIIINFALLFRKKVIIFAQGIGPINNKFGRFLTKTALKRCEYVSVRDEKSLFLLRDWGIDAKLVCDPLFDLKLVNSPVSNRVGIQLRSFKTLSESLLQKMAIQINQSFAEKSIEIYSFQESLDLKVCQRFEKMLKSLNPQIKTKIVHNQASAQILKEISGLDYMIAMRFHANLVALKYGIKTLAICYDEKVEKLAQESQIPYLSMLGTEDYAQKFLELEQLNSEKLAQFSSSKHFDWSGVEAIID